MSYVQLNNPNSLPRHPTITGFDIYIVRFKRRFVVCRYALQINTLRLLAESTSIKRFRLSANIMFMLYQLLFSRQCPTAFTNFITLFYWRTSISIVRDNYAWGRSHFWIGGMECVCLLLEKDRQYEDFWSYLQKSWTDI